MASLRAVRGQALAASGMLARDGIYWRVRSQTSGAYYRVDLTGQTPTCDCPDYEISGLKCKHIHAVQYFMRCEAKGIAPTRETAEPKRPTYRQDWPAYNLAQTREKAHFLDLLSALCQSIPEPEQHMGRPRHATRDLVFAAAFKVYSTVSARRFATDLADACDKGYLTRPVHHSSVFRIFENPDLVPILRSLIVRSSIPLKSVESHFTVDSSGFTTCQYVRWFDEKYGKQEEVNEDADNDEVEGARPTRKNAEPREMRDWLKVHLMCGATTNIVTSVEITGRDGADYNKFAPLVKDTAQRFTMAEVSADKAYLSREHLEMVVDLGATPYIPFKSNSKGRISSMDLWDQLYHFYMLHRETFLQHYHRRSLVESTFNMIKAKFGASIRCKTPVAQVNELLCKVLCHNICVLIQSMYELGIPPEFY